MKHLIKKEKNILHGTIGWSHNGKDGQYCEAGETVKIKWQPTAGWGLQEVHYTDEDGNVVAIEGGEFTMPDSAVTIGATFKRFAVEDWKNYEGIEISGGVEGNILQVGSDGKPDANPKVNVTADGDVNAGGDVNADGDVNAEGDVTADGNVIVGFDVTAKRNVNVGGYLKFKDTVSGDYYKVEVTNGALVVTEL